MAAELEGVHTDTRGRRRTRRAEGGGGRGEEDGEVPRLSPSRPGPAALNAATIAAYTVKLADRIEGHLRAGDFPLVLGGDCSIQLGASLAMRRIGRYGLAAGGGTPTRPDPDGLLPDELAAVLGTLLASERCVGLNVTIHDPDLDPDATAGALLAGLVVAAFADPS
ncbi:hypothetical protein [Streptomyces luteolus]|uniref:hypothetical protein n=1 Tax=Streptomyces luteolus TaxID=3043615 RepID=UPI0038D0E8B6